MDDWLKRYLTVKGLWNEDGISRRVSVQRCGGCRVRVLAGLDADVAAMTVFVDTNEINEIGEVVAVMFGLKTYDCVRLAHKKPNSWCLQARRADHVRNSGRYSIYVQHQCGLEIPKKFVARDISNDDDKPPF